MFGPKTKAGDSWPFFSPPPRLYSARYVGDYHEGWHYNVECCAAVVIKSGIRFQCMRSRWHGPEGMFCKQHAAGAIEGRK